MIFRTLTELDKLGRIRFPSDESFRSARFLIADDGMGFSYNENRVRTGVELTVWLKHHWEANFIISGKGCVRDLTRDMSWPLEAGVLYVVGPNDRHRLQFTEAECHISIFFPPLRGDERFDADGSYEPGGTVVETSRRMFVKNLSELLREPRQTVDVKHQVRSVPMLTDADDVGFRLSHVLMPANTEFEVQSSQHPTACHFVTGSGKVLDDERLPSLVGASGITPPLITP